MSAAEAVRVLVVGLGNMGLSHADAYHRNAGFEIVGLVNRSPVELPEGLPVPMSSWRNPLPPLSRTLSG